MIFMVADFRVIGYQGRLGGGEYWVRIGGR